MGFKINVNREVTIKHWYEEDKWFSVTFDFPYAEEIDFSSFRADLERLGLKTESEIKKVENMNNIVYTTLRRAIKGYEGLDLYLNGNPISFKNEDGSINPDAQRVVFQAVFQFNEMLHKAELAYLGELDLGNLETGLKPVQNGAGVQENVKNVTETEIIEDVKNVDTSKEKM